jgi:WD40 repeat protein
MRLFHLALVAVLLTVFAGLTRADEPKEDKKVTEEEIKQLIEQLGSDVFSKRKEAKNRLADIGEPAIPLLRKVLETTEDAEVRTTAAALVEAFDKTHTGQIRAFPGHGNRINGVAISRDGKRAVSACWDGVLRCWNVESGELIREMGRGPSYLNSCAITPEGKRALAGCADRNMYLWNLETGNLVRTFSGHAQGVWDVVFAPDGKRALSGCGDGITRLWNLESGDEIRKLETAPGGRAWTAAFTPDGKHAITGGGSFFEKGGESKAPLYLWDLGNGKQIRQFKGHTSDVRTVAVSPNGKQLLSGSFDGTMRLWDIETGKEIRKFEVLATFVEAVRFTGDGKRAASSFCQKREGATFIEECRIRLWDLETGKEIKQFRGHDGHTISLAVAEAADYMISGSDDSAMRLWQLPK